MKKALINILKLAVIALCFGLIASKINLRDIGNQLAGVSLPLVGVAGLTILLEPVVMAFKWNILLREKGINLGVRRLIRIIFSSNFLSVTLPTSLGADALRLLMVKGAQQSLAHAAGALMADRLLGALAIVTLSLVGVVLVGRQTLDPRSLLSILTVALLVLAIAGVLISRLPVRWVPRLRRWAVRRAGDRPPAAGLPWLLKAVDQAEAMHESLRSFGAHRARLAQVFLLNFSAQGLRVLQIGLLFQAVHHPVPWTQAAAFVPMIVLMAMLPISYFGLGVKENAFFYFFGRAGVPNPVSFSVSVITYPLIVVAMLPGALFVLCDVWRRPAAAPPPANPSNP
ncbi:MAG: lysylphosphatidylglycerol synthase transmembrane domain-containing protein [Kiritimatiellaeota bacterium]|nr:lysylphosphatidylglycerol synthase transmembrane domain-containing protein [Kiritimatiellota bacterium]